MSPAKPYALITGASGGIGLEIAKLFAIDKINLILVARSKDKLEAIAADFKNSYKIDVKIISKDLSDAVSSIEIFSELEQEKIEISYLVNNAGFASNGKFYELDLQGELDEIQVNVTTLTHLTRLFLPKMVESKFGKILNVASTAAFQPGPFMATYYATKAFVLSFGEAINNELHGTGVSVTTLCPGPTKTGFDKRAGTTDLPLFNMSVMDSQIVAKIGYEAMIKRKMTVIAGFNNLLQVLLVKFLPRKTVINIVRRVQERKS